MSSALEVPAIMLDHADRTSFISHSSPDRVIEYSWCILSPIIYNSLYFDVLRAFANGHWRERQAEKLVAIREAASTAGPGVSPLVRIELVSWNEVPQSTRHHRHIGFYQAGG
jgi:hypothetical protein